MTSPSPDPQHADDASTGYMMIDVEKEYQICGRHWITWSASVPSEILRNINGDSKW
jgi:hypothetical protein